MRTLRLLAALALLPAAAHAGPLDEEWAASFHAATLAPLLPERLGAVIVVEAGSDDDDRRDAARQVRKALRASGRASAVLDGDLLGDASRLDDAALVRRAAGLLAVDAVLTVRVRRDGGDPEARLALFRADGATLRLLVAAAGQPPHPEPLSRPPLVPSPATPPSAALLAAGERIVTFGHPQADERLDDMAPRLGLYAQEQLDPEGFFVAVGRPDLAARYLERLQRHRARRVAGIALVVVGGAGLTAAAYLAGMGGKTEAAVGIGVSGGLLALAGVGLFVANAIVPESPVSGQEALRLAREHNNEVRGHYGLPLEWAPDHPPPPRASLAPLLLRGGGGLQLSLAF